MNEDAMLRMADEIGRAQWLLERAEAALGEVSGEYFNGLANRPNTAEGVALMAIGFDKNRIWSDIALDYAHQLRKALADIASLARSARG
jgi:hypothetical protein